MRKSGFSRHRFNSAIDEPPQLAGTDWRRPENVLPDETPPVAFHEVRFPDDISRGARGGRRAAHADRRARLGATRSATPAGPTRAAASTSPMVSAAPTIFAAVVAFFEARNGRLHGFRFKGLGRSQVPACPRAHHRRPTRRSEPVTARRPLSSWRSAMPRAVRHGWRTITKPVAVTVRRRLRRRGAAWRLDRRLRPLAS